MIFLSRALVLVASVFIPEMSRSARTADPMWIPLILGLMSTLWFFSENKGSIVLLLEKAAVSRLGGGVFAQGAPTLLCPPTQVFRCSHEKRPLRRLPGNLPVICKGDHHHVGRLGHSASPRTAEQPRMSLTTNNTMECGISQMTGSRGDAAQPSAASQWQGFGALSE